MGVFGAIRSRSCFILTQKAANSGSLESTIRLASMYEEGDAVEKDIDKAISLFKNAIALEKGDGEALWRLANLYLDSLDYSIDSYEVTSLMLESAKRGYDSAISVVAEFAESGDRRNPLNEEAFFILHKNADKGLGSAKMELATILLESKFPERRNKGEALDILQSESLKGNELAHEKLMQQRWDMPIDNKIGGVFYFPGDVLVMVLSKLGITDYSYYGGTLSFLVSIIFWFFIVFGVLLR